MVKKVSGNGKIYFKCEACDMNYETRELAQKCEDFCEKNKACSTEIIKHAMKL
jgi:hypothetical protein